MTFHNRVASTLIWSYTALVYRHLEAEAGMELIWERYGWIRSSGAS